MGSLLSNVLRAFFNSEWAKKILLGLGISLVTTAVPLTILNYYLSNFLNNIQIGSLSAMALSLMHIAMVDKAISIVIGAYVVKFNIKATSLIFQRLSK